MYIAMHLGALLSILLGVSPADAGTGVTIQVPKKEIRIIKKECFVVATEAKRLAQWFPIAQTHASELWSRISQDNDTAGAMTLLDIPLGMDVLGNRHAPNGLGWRTEFLDSVDLASNQRHHFGFYYFVGAAGWPASPIAFLGAIVNDYNDAIQNNTGDLRLADAARDLGTWSRVHGVTEFVGKDIHSQFCQ